jgi:hypothetical protein
MATSVEKKTNSSAEDGILPTNSCGSPVIPSELSRLEIESEPAPDSAGHDATPVLDCVFGSSEPRSQKSAAVSWKRGTSHRVLRYSTQASDESTEERRGVVVTPLTRKNGAAMGAGRRFLSNFRGSVREDGSDESPNDGVQIYRVQSTKTINLGCHKVRSRG